MQLEVLHVTKTLRMYDHIKNNILECEQIMTLKLYIHIYYMSELIIL